MVTLNTFVFRVAIVGTVSIGACLILHGPVAGAGVAVTPREFAAGNNAFALDLYSRLPKEPGNVVVSPYSIDEALAMTYAGARAQTAEQIARVLHFAGKRDTVHSAVAFLRSSMNDTKTSGCQLVLANSLWGQRGYAFKRSFSNTVREQYGAYLGQVDFAANTDGAARQINAWIAARTQGRIQGLIPSGALHSQTLLVIVNAVYFMGSWAIPFDGAQTKELPFAVRSGESVAVPMMKTAGYFRYAETATLQALEMPYGTVNPWEEIAKMPFPKVDPREEIESRLVSNRFSMVILLPKKADGFSELEQSLTVAQLDALRDETHAKWVMVALPRFRINCGFSLADTLRAMGMGDAFSEARADFSGIASLRPLFVQDVLHKVFVDVNEIGTEASAASALLLTHGGDPYAPLFNANHPFLFLIRHNPTGAILFLGRLANPLG